MSKHCRSIYFRCKTTVLAFTLSVTVMLLLTDLTSAPDDKSTSIKYCQKIQEKVLSVPISILWKVLPILVPIAPKVSPILLVAIPIWWQWQDCLQELSLSQLLARWLHYQTQTVCLQILQNEIHPSFPGFPDSLNSLFHYNYNVKTRCNESPLQSFR